MMGSDAAMSCSGYHDQERLRVGGRLSQEGLGDGHVWQEPGKRAVKAGAA